MLSAASEMPLHREEKMFKTLMIFAAAITCLVSTEAIAGRCNITNEDGDHEDRVVTVRRSVTVTTPGLPPCKISAGTRMNVNNKCGCKDGRLLCNVNRLRNDHVYSGTFPEVVSGRCTIRRGARCRPRKTGDCP
jgi:hypothetical protein